MLQYDGDAQMMVILTNKEMSYLVVGLFDHLVGSFLYIYF